MEPNFESTTSVTPEAFRAFVERRDRAGDDRHYELLNGRIVVTPPAAWPHGEIGSRVQFVLSAWIVPRKLGRVFDSSQGFELPTGDTVEPDHTFISHERWGAASPRPGAFLSVVPDLIVEVLSPSTTGYDRHEKRLIYERNGVREYWLLDPRSRTLLALLLSDGRFAATSEIGAGSSWRSQVLDGLEVDVGALFPEP